MDGVKRKDPFHVFDGGTGEFYARRFTDVGARYCGLNDPVLLRRARFRRNAPPKFTNVRTRAPVLRQYAARRTLAMDTRGAPERPNARQTKRTTRGNMQITTTATTNVGGHRC